MANEMKWVYLVIFDEGRKGVDDGDFAPPGCRRKWFL
jgi:hypothetical protein